MSSEEDTGTAMAATSVLHALEKQDFSFITGYLERRFIGGLGGARLSSQQVGGRQAGLCESEPDSSH